MMNPMAGQRPLFLLHATVVVPRGGEVLMVREAKQATRGKWNLPGGHVEHDEALPQAAARELLEETGLGCPLVSLLGVYTGGHSARFVFVSEPPAVEPRAGHEILEVRFFRPADVLAMSDEQVVSPVRLRAILRDVEAGRGYPLSVMAHFLGSFPPATTVLT